MNDSRESLGLSDWSKIEVLLDKAIDSPASITQEEKHKIAEWIPSREEMESRVQKHLSRSLNDLFHHAATDRDSLTYLDCVMIHQGFHLFDKLTQAGRDIQRRHRENQQPELYAKWERARATVLSELELRAVLNVTDPGFYRQKQAGYLTPRLKEHERTRGRPAEWVKRIIDQGDDKTWGFRIYCSLLDDSSEWNYFHQQFHRIVDDLPLMELGNEEIRDSKHTELINFDGREDDIGRLRQDFRTIRDQGGLKSGILQHVFLFVTPECRDSYPEAYYPWLWAIDPDWSLDGADQDGYDGRVPINWGACYQKFYNFVSIHQYSLKEIWLDYHEVCKKWPEKRIPGWGLTLLDQPKWPDY